MSTPFIVASFAGQTAGRLLSAYVPQSGDVNATFTRFTRSTNDLQFGASNQLDVNSGTSGSQASYGAGPVLTSTQEQIDLTFNLDVKSLTAAYSTLGALVGDDNTGNNFVEVRILTGSIAGSPAINVYNTVGGASAVNLVSSNVSLAVNTIYTMTVQIRGAVGSKTISVLFGPQGGTMTTIANQVSVPGLTMVGRYVGLRPIYTPATTVSSQPDTDGLHFLNFNTASVPVVLTANNVTPAAASATSVKLTTLSAYNGTSPYTYQFQRATVTGGTVGAYSNVGTAGTALTYTDTGLTAGGVFSYQVVVTDSASGTATSPSGTSYTVPGVGTLPYVFNNGDAGSVIRTGLNASIVNTYGPSIFPTPGTGNDAQAIQNAINLAKASGLHSNVMLGNATWICTSQIKLDPTYVSLVGAGATLDFRTAPSSISAAVVVDNQVGTYGSITSTLEAFTILCTGVSIQCLLIASDVSTNGYVSAIYCERIQCNGGSTGLVIGQNAYIMSFVSCSFANASGTQIIRTGAPNSGENINFHGCGMSGGGNLVESDGQNSDMYFFGCSFDYPGNQQYIYANNGYVTCVGCHFEGTPPSSTGSQFKLDNGGRITIISCQFISANPSQAPYTFTVYGGGGTVICRDVQFFNWAGTSGICNVNDCFYNQSTSLYNFDYRLTMAASITTLAHQNAGSIFAGTLNANSTLSNPFGISHGQKITWAIKQAASGTGPFTLAYGSKFKWPGGTVPTFPTTAGAVCTINGVYNGQDDVIYATFGASFA